jgi:23S rRNA maturation-related 3'-5' exoribonuclease YhaM
MWVIEPGERSVMHSIFSYCVRVGDAVSQLINVVVFLSTNPNESLSGRSYRQKHHWFWGKMLVVIDAMFYPIQKEHCRKSHEADVKRASDLLKSAV